ncbi:MAG TPA: hypothetical protein P5572_01855 [Phycisphaerae bacterium]|nr:hypothetical protein [Phycisphaerae bacterium]
MKSHAHSSAAGARLGRAGRIVAGTLAAVFGMVAAAGSAARAESIYYLDFAPDETGPVYTYSPVEKGIILDGLRTMYAAFPHMTFTLDEPTVPFSRVGFNTTAIGTSTGIDFRNIADIDSASVNALLAFDFLGITTPAPADIVKASMNLAGHEIGHLEGLRHHDSFTPIGSGVPGSAVAAGFTPPYPGPTTAPLTLTDVQSLTTALPGGFTPAQLTADLIVGQRAAIKLAFNEDPAYYLESSLPGGPAGDDSASAPSLPLKTIAVPNVTSPGDPIHGLPLVADVIAVRGATTDPFDMDYYRFFAYAGDYVQIEVLSNVIAPRLDEFNPAVLLITPDEMDPDFPGDYYSTDMSGDEPESDDVLMIDFHVPETKDYVLAVFGQFPGHPPDDFGEYELYIAEFRTAPPPPCNDPFADADGDGDVDLGDFEVLQRCPFNDPVGMLPPECICFDHDHNGELNGGDLAAFTDCVTGAGALHATDPNPLCSEQP